MPVEKIWLSGASLNGTGQFNVRIQGAENGRFPIEMINSNSGASTSHLSGLDSSRLKINVNMNPLYINGEDYCRTYRDDNSYLSETITQGVNQTYEPVPYEFWMFGCYDATNLQTPSATTAIDSTKTYAKISLEYNTSPKLKLAEFYFLYDQNTDLSQLHNTYKETLSCLRQLKLGLASRAEFSVSKPNLFANDFPNFSNHGQPIWGEKLRIDCYGE